MDKEGRAFPRKGSIMCKGHMSGQKEHGENEEQKEVHMAGERGRDRKRETRERKRK